MAVRCSVGSFAPCSSGDPQYVTHTSVSTNAGGPAKRQVWGFTWTAPGFRRRSRRFRGRPGLASNNNDKGTNGDLTVTAMTASLYAPTSSADASVERRRAQRRRAQRSDQAIAPKQLLSIFGTNLNARGVHPSDRRGL
ncbi:MAG: hypothetical protein R2748_17890 [Bryobacterales bacterium]